MQAGGAERRDQRGLVWNRFFFSTPEPRIINHFTTVALPRDRLSEHPGSRDADTHGWSRIGCIEITQIINGRVAKFIGAVKLLSGLCIKKFKRAWMRPMCSLDPPRRAL